MPRTSTTRLQSTVYTTNTKGYISSPTLDEHAVLSQTPLSTMSHSLIPGIRSAPYNRPSRNPLTTLITSCMFSLSSVATTGPTDEMPGLGCPVPHTTRPIYPTDAGLCSCSLFYCFFFFCFCGCFHVSPFLYSLPRPARVSLLLLARRRQGGGGGRGPARHYTQQV